MCRTVCKRKVGKVLMVNSVELGFLNQTQQVRKFQCDRASGLECSLETSGKVVDVWYMGMQHYSRMRSACLP